MTDQDWEWLVGGSLGGIGVVLGAILWGRTHPPVTTQTITLGPGAHGTQSVNITGSGTSPTITTTTTAPQLVVQSIAITGEG